MSPFLCAQENDLSDEELEAIAQREMLVFMITYAPLRFDKNMQLGEQEKQVIIPNRMEIIEKLKRKDYIIDDKINDCKETVNTLSSSGCILLSEQIPGILPFILRIELIIGMCALNEEKGELIESESISLIRFSNEVNHED